MRGGHFTWEAVEYADTEHPRRKFGVGVLSIVTADEIRFGSVDLKS